MTGITFMDQVINSRSIMLDYAVTTGLSDASRKPRRYLWTDAFAVCNYLELFRQTGEQDFLQLALKLVDQVHEVLGRHRPDSAHSGWISGLDEAQARLHPTLGGLRIGKRLDERQPLEAINHSLEWDQDGQYFHYLTKWMHALYCVSRETGSEIHMRWALELARTAHAAFTYGPPDGEGRRMYWKMSIDLSRPLVDSMGQHDPLDGLVTCLQLEAGAKRYPGISSEISLKTEIAQVRAMCEGVHFATADSLGIGGLLTDAYKLVQLIDTHGLDESVTLEVLLRDIENSLHSFIEQHQLNARAEYRLAFRELGLVIGLHTISRMLAQVEKYPEKFANFTQVKAVLSRLQGFKSVHDYIVNFWLEPRHRSVKTWKEHADISGVMLATALASDRYLQL